MYQEVPILMNAVHQDNYNTINMFYTPFIRVISEHLFLINLQRNNDTSREYSSQCSYQYLPAAFQWTQIAAASEVITEEII